MRIAQVNKFLTLRGGADAVMLRTARLLRERGHAVSLMGMAPVGPEARDFPAYTVPPVDYGADLCAGERVTAAGRLLYSVRSRGELSRMIRRERPDVIHFHNVYHQLSPSVIDAARAAGVPTVMTLHDYKVTCPIYTHYRDGGVCEMCRGGRFYNVVRYRCTDGSLSRSALNAVEMYLHRRLLRIYRKVDLFAAPSRFLIGKVRELGFKAPMAHLPNCVAVDRFRPAFEGQEGRVGYFGRLSDEKGLLTLLQAIRGTELDLLVVGSGPQEAELRRRAPENVRFTGRLNGRALRDAVRGCMFTVLPSEWYENHPLSVVESFALGKPVVGADIGGIPELVGERRGTLFRPGDAQDLRRAMGELAADPDAVRRMGRRARRYVERELSPGDYYTKLMAIYERAARGEAGA